MSKKQPTEAINIKQFIQCVNEKNYAAADKYLKAAVEDKLLQKMINAKPTNIFKNER